MNAAKKGDVSKVAEMLEAGMPVDITNEDGETALITASCYNQTDVVRCLLKNGANVNKQDRDGCTVLHVASCSNNTDVMRLLLAYGARKDIQDKHGMTPIDVARRWNRKEALDLLEQYQVSTSYKFTNHLLMFRIREVKMQLPVKEVHLIK